MGQGELFIHCIHEKRARAMNYTRRQFLRNAATASALLATGCVSPHGHKASYTSRILKPQNQNPVFHWTDAALQQVRDQRATPPLAAYCCALPMAAGFLAANGILQAYEEPFGIGSGPRGAEPGSRLRRGFRKRGGGSVPAALPFRAHGVPGSLSRGRGEVLGRQVGPSRPPARC